ncbi:hypothetical protein L0128_18805 [candidate division KSB1 bacterium]|nr:hypothetical protein [candidate division KSB1 bacterium]
MRILVISSKPLLSIKLNQYVHQPEYEFIFTNSAKEGLELIRKRRLEVVISNLGNSANTDDIEFMLNLKEIYPHLPVIIVFNDNLKLKAENVLKAGAFACLDESLPAEEVMHQVKKAMLGNAA